MAEVKAFKMHGGDEVVASVLDVIYHPSNLESTTERKVKCYVLRRPHILQFQPMSNGQLGLAFVPWTLSNPSVERLEVPAEAVLLMFDAAERVEAQYLEQTTGISLAPPGARIST
jgi:hypothetical protein